MTKFAFAAAVMMIVTTACPAQEADARAAQALAHAAQLADHEARLAALEQRAGIAAPGGKRTYEEARQLALDTNRPLVTWAGAAICPPCIAATEGEWVNFVGTPDGYPTDSIAVFVPDGQGQLRGGTAVTDWITGDAVYGHVPSVRRFIQNWRSRRAATVQPQANYAVAYQPVAFAGAGFGFGGGMMPGGGGCATCGTAGGRFAFGRR